MTEPFSPEIENRSIDRLVPENFQPDEEGELILALTAKEPNVGYPTSEDRLQMTDEQIDEWYANGCNFEALRLRPSREYPNGVNWVGNHPNRLAKIAKEEQEGIPESESVVQRDDGIQNLHGVTFRKPLLEGWTEDSRGAPLAPWTRTALKYGAVTGPGFYYILGENPSANIIAFGENEGKLQLAVIERYDVQADSRTIFVPGGMIDPGEDPVTAALREAHEETDFLKDIGITDIEGKKAALSLLKPLKIKALGTGRLTVNAGEVSASVVVVPRDQNIRNHPLKQGSDARHAIWTPLTSNTLNRLYLPHANDVRLGVLAYERQNGVKIAPDGMIHMS